MDRNDYSIDPAFAGRRAEATVCPTEVTAAVLDGGELACRQRHDVEVEVRPFSRYDQLIPA